jgi:8-amino-7-oxononanoate synthase
MSSFESELTARIQAIREQGLYRSLRRVESAQGPVIKVGDQTLLNFSSNDYLGLAAHPALIEAAQAGTSRFGAGAGASRLICGSLACHHELEEAVAAFKGTEAALSFSSGYATAIGTLCALLDRNSVVVIDRLVHACIVDAARLSGARLRVFAHNDLDNLERILRWASKARGPLAPHADSPGRKGTVVIVTESVFSMDGDVAPLREMVELKERYGAWLMVDEAHATGLYGAHRRGLIEKAGVSDRVEVQMGTLGKALGSAGGYIAGSRVLVDYLVNKARSFIFSTAPVPAAAVAATAAVRLVQSAEGEARCARLWDNVKTAQVCVNGVATAASMQLKVPSAILPLILEEEEKALKAADQLRERGLFVPAIRFPTVARGAARLRFTLTAAHEPSHLERLKEALATFCL